VVLFTGNRLAQSNTKWGQVGSEQHCIGKAWRMRKDGEDRYWPNARTNEVPAKG